LRFFRGGLKAMASRN